jgi:hypothetical protein
VADRETLLARLRRIVFWDVSPSTSLAVCGRCGSVIVDDDEWANRGEHEAWHDAIEAPAGQDGDDRG